MIKKIVCAALTTALLISSAVGVMAAGYSTTTKYSGGGIEVSSTVSGVAVGDTLTYLAWEDVDANSEMADNEVVYIDQIVADATTETFTYAADKADIKAKVLYGGKTASGAAVTVSDNTVIPGMITVKVGETVIAQGCGSDKGEAYVKVKYADDYTGSKVFSSVKNGDSEVAGWFSAADGLWIPADVLDGVEEVTLTATEVASAAVTVKTYGIKQLTDKNALVILAQAKNAGSDYGVIVSSDNFTTTTAVNYEVASTDDKTIKYVAAGANKEGAFLIELDYEEDSIPAGSYSAKAYAGTAEGVVVGPVVVEEPAAE